MKFFSDLEQRWLPLRYLCLPTFLPRFPGCSGQRHRNWNEGPTNPTDPLHSSEENRANDRARAMKPPSTSERRVGDIFGLACTPNGLRFGQSPLAAFAGRTSDRGIDTAGTDAIDADAILAQFDRCAIGEVDYTRLGGAVDRRAKASLHPRHRS